MDLCENCQSTNRNEYLQCYYCKSWTHSKCYNISESDMKIWDPAYLKFVCRSCAFAADGTYDASAALVRLTVVRLTGRRTALTNQAETEKRLLCMYNVQTEEISGNNGSDPVAEFIIKMFEPSLANGLSPLKTMADGNCMYRAVSLALTGSENYHAYLRLITANELILNRDSYDTRKKYNDFIKDIRIITSDYAKIVEDALTEGSYSEMAHIYALSAAVGQPIRSVYPGHKDNELAVAFNRTVRGRGLSADAKPGVTLMWTSTSIPKNHQELRINHFVPLVEKLFHDYNSDHSFSNHNDWDSVVETSEKNVCYSENVRSICDNNQPSECKILKEESLCVCDKIDELCTCVQTDGESVTSDGTTGPLHGFMSTETAIAHLTSGKKGLNEIPGGIKQDVYFLLDNTTNMTQRRTGKQSDFPDDCGIWDTDKGTSPKTYYIKIGPTFKQTWTKDKLFCYRKKNKGKIEYVPYDPQPDISKIYPVQRYYATLKKDNSYKKRVTWLQNYDLAVVEYLGKFPGLGSHGNSTTGSEYIRLAPKVMEEMQMLNGKMKPHQILNRLTDKYDELTQPSCLRQVHDKLYREKKKEIKLDGHIYNFADQVRQIENQVSENSPYVRSVIRTSGRTPSITLFTDEQIDDLKTLCCTGSTVLGIDKTFMLCKMHVTVTCYKQLTVRTNKTGQPPIFLGPIFIHDNSDFETFSHFLYQLRLKLHDIALNKLVIGSDDERALVKAIETAFPDSRHILCTRHLEENARHVLTDDAVTKKQKQYMLNRIFGDDGLMDADDSICYDKMASDIDQDLAQISTKFRDYFKKRLNPLLKSKVNVPQRENQVIKHWTNNNCESMNHVLKQTIDWKSQPLPDLVRLLHELVKGQFKRLRSALLQTGDYRLADTHRQFEKTKTDWIKMTEKQRSNHFRRFRLYVHCYEKKVVSTDGMTTVIAPKTNGRKPGQTKRKPKTLSIKSKRAKTDD